MQVPLTCSKLALAATEKMAQLGLDSPAQPMILNMLIFTGPAATEFTIVQCKYFIQSFEGRFEQKAQLHAGSVVHVLSNMILCKWHGQV